MVDWGHKFAKTLGYKLMELTGDSAPDARALATADILCTTPEKWDGVSRHWQQRAYVRQVGLVIIDEIHLLGEDRGPILEVIVSRMRYIATKTAQQVRVVGLSTAMANAHDLAEWLGIPQDGLFNFKPSVRPVPLEVHIAGFPGKHYCPRMATMNKPTYRAILNHSPDKPTLVFVSSRRQTRLTALDLIAYCSADEREQQFVNIAQSELEPLLARVKDQALRHTLAFGVGIHHAGLAETDRSIVEQLFVQQKIMVLVCTSTLAWGVNFPAHLVVVKGTEFYDGAQKRYVDFPVTDVLQMMGRAGRPQYDQQGVAVILVHEPKKTFYRKFLYEPFLSRASCRSSCTTTSTRRSSPRPSARGRTASTSSRGPTLPPPHAQPRLLPPRGRLDEGIAEFLSNLVEATLADLQNAGCVEIIESESGVDVVKPTILGHIASYYYLKYTTVALFCAEVHDVDDPPTDLPTLLRILCDASEFDELPVRHNEEHVHFQMAKELPWAVDQGALDSPHVKAMLLLQAHFARTALPMSDYVTDTKSVLDQALRVLQAMVDVCADGGWLYTTLGAMHLAQMVTQARFLDESASDGSALTDLPHVDEAVGQGAAPARRDQPDAADGRLARDAERVGALVWPEGATAQRAPWRAPLAAAHRGDRLHQGRRGERRAAVTARGGGLRRRPPRRAQPRVALQGVRAALPQAEACGLVAGHGRGGRAARTKARAARRRADAGRARLCGARRAGRVRVEHTARERQLHWTRPDVRSEGRGRVARPWPSRSPLALQPVLPQGDYPDFDCVRFFL